MGRSKVAIDTDDMIELLEAGLSKKEVAAALGVTVPTIDNRINDLRREESALLSYNKVHFLDLIRVKERVLANMTEDKMVAAPLGILANTYGIIAKQEQLLQGRPTEIHGLMGYLMHIEELDRKKKDEQSVEEDSGTPLLEAGAGQ